MVWFSSLVDCCGCYGDDDGRCVTSGMLVYPVIVLSRHSTVKHVTTAWSPADRGSERGGEGHAAGVAGEGAAEMGTDR